MVRQVLWQMVLLVVCVLGTALAADEAADIRSQLLPGDRVLLGTVTAVAAGQAQIDTGESHHRFVPMNRRKAKGLPDFKKGDRVELIVNDQNLLVGEYLAGEKAHYLVVRGQLVQPLVTGHNRAVIRTADGTEDQCFIRPVARSKVASIPVGVEAVFLIDELHQIVDATYGSKEAVHHAAELWQKKTPLKGNFSHVDGVIHEPLANNTVVIRTENGTQKRYGVRPLDQARLANLTKGDFVVLLVDDENMVIDVAIPPKSSGRAQ